MALFAFKIIISCLSCNDSNNKVQLSNFSLALFYCAQVPEPVSLRKTLLSASHTVWAHKKISIYSLRFICLAIFNSGFT